MAVKITTGFGISSEQSPVCNGVLKFNFTPAKLSEATSTTSVLSIAEVPANTQIVVTDAWLVVNTAYQTGTSVMVGDSAYDNNILADTGITSTGTKATSSGSKGQLLSTNATGLVTTRLTITLTASTAVSLHSAGDVDLYIAFTEIQASDVSETSLGTSILQSAVGTPSGSLNSQISVAGSSGQLQYNNGSSGLAAYTTAAARTHLGLEIATTHGSASGGKALLTTSGGLTIGDLLSIDAGGQIVAGSLPTQSITQDTYPFGAVEVLSTGVVTSVKSNTHETNNIALTSPGSYALSAYQALPTRSNSYDTNPFYSHYVVTNAVPLVSGISAVKYPDPNGYAEGTTLTVSFAHCNDQFGTGASVFEPPNPFYDRNDSTSTSYALLNVKQMLGLVPDSGSFTGNPFICADTDHAFYYSGSGSNGFNTTYGFAAYSNECPLFLLSPGGSVTLSVVTARDASNASKKTWQIIAHYDRYPQYVLKTGTMPYSG